MKLTTKGDAFTDGRLDVFTLSLGGEEQKVVRRPGRPLAVPQTRPQSPEAGNPAACGYVGLGERHRRRPLLISLPASRSW